MGAISAWRQILASPAQPQEPRPVRLASPFSKSALQSIVWSDIFGNENMPITRGECMAVPAVARARHLITGALSPYPLTAYRADVEVDDQPAWLYRTNGQTPPQIRMLWTIDDLIFYGWSLWAVLRDERPTNYEPSRPATWGRILDAQRVPADEWEFDDDGRILVNAKPVTDESVILFPGPFEGLCYVARRTIDGARNIESAWSRRVKQPIPAVELHQTTDEELDDDEIDAVLSEWGAMLNSGGGVAYTPYNIDVRTHGEAKTDLFIEGRNAVALDIGRFLNVPGTLLDASLATSSLQYSTELSSRNSFLDQTVTFWRNPIEARLSMDDIVSAGQRVAFDLSALTEIPQTGQSAVTED